MARYHTERHPGLDKIITINLLNDTSKIASLTETLAYIMQRTYEAPMPTEWVNIYTWLGL